VKTEKAFVDVEIRYEEKLKTQVPCGDRSQHSLISKKRSDEIGGKILINRVDKHKLY